MLQNTWLRRPVWEIFLIQQGTPKPSQLFLSWATKKPVTKATISRWLTTTLKLAGIDTTQFTAHSYRGAGLSAAHSKGASIEKIVEHGNWSNVDTFHSYYNAPDRDSPIGQIILNHFKPGESYLYGPELSYCFLVVLVVIYGGPRRHSESFIHKLAVKPVIAMSYYYRKCYKVKILKWSLIRLSDDLY